MNPEIALVYDADCPNAPAARAALREALLSVGLEPCWREYDRAAPGTPASLACWGSPSILVNGRDICGEAGSAAADSCRVYQSGQGLRGIPPIEVIAAALADHVKAGSAGSIPKSTASAAIALAFASTLGWLCCLPLVGGAIGVTLAGVAATMGPWWPLFAGASVMFLAITVVRTVGASQFCATNGRRRRPWLFLTAIGALTFFLLSLPWWTAELTYLFIR
jgi:hypothetical protein